MKILAIKSFIACGITLLAAQVQAAITFDDFNVTEGHFALQPSFSGSSANIATSSTADRITTDNPREGAGHEKIVLNAITEGAASRCRFLSGGGTIGNNTSFTTSAGEDGWIGVHVKTLDPDWTVQIWIENASNNGSIPKTVIADGEWHLYEWNLDDTTGGPDGWGTISGILSGSAIVADGAHSIDSVLFRHAAAPATSTLFMDFVAKSDSGSVSNLLTEPCLATSGVVVSGPLSTNSNEVIVSGVDAAATSLKVYQNSGSGMVQIGSTNANIVAGDNRVTVSGLVKGAQVAATQTINGQESCVPQTGLFVGGGENPPVRVAVTIKETTDAGPVGASATDISSVNLHFMGASLLSGGAPVNAPIISPSNDWQTVTFSRGDFVTVGDSANAAGEPVDGAGYPAQNGASLQVFAFKQLAAGVKVFSSFPTESGFISSNEAPFDIKWTWDAVPDADGYRLLRSFNGAGYLEGHDVLATNSYTDNNTGWITNASAISVVPATARSQPSVKWNSGAGDPVGTQNNIPGDWGILESINFAIAADTGPFDLYIDSLQNGATVFQTFETVAAGTTGYGFRPPNFSGTTQPNILTTPHEGVVTNLVADTGTNSFRARFQFSSTNVNRWLRLTTSGAGSAANPLVNLDDPISFRFLLLPVGASLPGGAPTISYSLNGNQVILNWTGTFNLESKTNLNEATWTSVGVNTGPYTNLITGTARFFQLRNP